MQGSLLLSKYVLPEEIFRYFELVKTVRECRELHLYPEELNAHPHLNGKQLCEQYKEHLSDYKDWEEKDHASEWLVFPKNTGIYLSIDETALPDGELVSCQRCFNVIAILRSNL